MSAARLLHILILAACLQLLLPSMAQAMQAMKPAKDAAMDGVRARSGIALGVSDIEIYNHRSYWAYEDTSADGSRIAFEDVHSFYRVDSHEPVMLRVFQNNHGLPVVAMEALAHFQENALDQDMTLYVDSFVFCDQDLGRLQLSGPGSREFAVYASPLGAFEDHDGQSGIGFQFETRAVLDEFSWAYNDHDGRFGLGGVHLAGKFDDDGNPGGRFTIGRLGHGDENNGTLGPASFQVLQDEEGRGFIRMYMPMEGSIRIDDIGMGGHDLGPMIIDDMTVHHLQVDFVPF